MTRSRPDARHSHARHGLYDSVLPLRLGTAPTTPSAGTARSGADGDAGGDASRWHV